jgi:NAD(P)-dependent dehydrogenase (short-subunit alcohol dehydrogenase family)
MERTIVVTGAGSGIGQATAIEAAGLGFGVVATVHHTDQVGPLERQARSAGASLVIEVLDVTDDARAQEIIERHRPWGLVNAAGLMLPGMVADTPPADARRHLDVMVLAPLRLAQLALPGMRRQGGGRIVNVSSIAGDANGPFLGWYEAAKQALGAVTDALRPEVARYAVDVVLVEPGPHATPLWDKARTYLERRQAAALEPDLYDGPIGLVEEMSRRGGDPQEVATTIGGVLHAGRPRFRYRVGRGSNVLPLVNKVVPTSVRDRLTRSLAGL